ncbi:MAG: nucleoside deaminase [Clostridia bacterium]|nr:nucleoside deaminase [Clostridia bacterium]
MLHETFMRIALEIAEEAGRQGDIPVGAVVAQGGMIIAKAHNRRELDRDPFAHAEMLALRDAAKALGRRRLSDCTLYVTLEPCPMCAGALVMAHLGMCYFAARDERQGCVESVYAIPQDSAFSHRVPCVGGLLEEEARAQLKRFFQNCRPGNKEQTKREVNPG